MVLTGDSSDSIKITKNTHTIFDSIFLIGILRKRLQQQQQQQQWRQCQQIEM